jgi:two-component system, response regulator PdtaR
METRYEQPHLARFDPGFRHRRLAPGMDALTRAGLARRPTVLVVEDEVLIRMNMADALAAAGFDVREAENAAEALKLVREQGPTDALVTDVMMPGSIDGFELACIIARCWPRTAIVVCSGNAQPNFGDLPSGAAFIPKPYAVDAVVKALRRSLGGGDVKADGSVVPASKAASTG